MSSVNMSEVSSIEMKLNVSLSLDWIVVDQWCQCSLSVMELCIVWMVIVSYFRVCCECMNVFDAYSLM